MSILKSLIRWGASNDVSAITDQSLIDLETKRIKMIFDSLLKQGFNDTQAVRIIAGMCSQNA